MCDDNVDMTGRVMAEDEKTCFRVDFGGGVLELSGDRDFVETMYQRVMADVETARRRIQDRQACVEMPKPDGGKRPSVWLHRCGDLMRKIYMASRNDVEESAIGDIVDVEELRCVYIDDELFSELFGRLEGGNTLWAEFTEVGRDKIAEATDPAREALRPQGS